MLQVTGSDPDIGLAWSVPVSVLRPQNAVAAQGYYSCTDAYIVQAVL